MLGLIENQYVFNSVHLVTGYEAILKMLHIFNECLHYI